MPIVHPFRNRIPCLALSVVLLCVLFPAKGMAVRIKDVARIEGMDESQLIGYGLVVGLKGSGDGPRTAFTTQSVINMLRNMGIEVPKDRIQVRNVAAVMITAKMTPYHKRGQALDVLVSSLGDAKSLEGGTLLLSPLQDARGEIYAMAQGALSVGGVSRESNLGKASLSKNHTLAGRVPNGALVQKEIPSLTLSNTELRVDLQVPDFSSAVNMAKAVNAQFKSEVATAIDPVTVKLSLPQEWQSKPMEFAATLENLDFEIASIARVVLNEKTGTVISGGNVSISEVAVAHGNITIEIKQTENNQVQTASAPGATTQQSVSNTNETIQANEDKSMVKVLPASTKVSDLAKSLNALGVTPRDIIAIFQAIKAAGALHADLMVM
jgi:flagellar P-ring protein FlgI